jgi:hypothetical protein
MLNYNEAGFSRKYNKGSVGLSEREGTVCYERCISLKIHSVGVESD